MKNKAHLSQIQRVHDEACRELEFWEEQDSVDMFELAKSPRCCDLWRQIEKADRLLNPVSRKEARTCKTN
jgi:hypothetical protein